jgi:hypothetical protein
MGGVALCAGGNGLSGTSKNLKGQYSSLQVSILSFQGARVIFERGSGKAERGILLPKRLGFQPEWGQASSPTGSDFTLSGIQGGSQRGNFLPMQTS